MALFGLGKKKEEVAHVSSHPDSSITPTDQVLSMRQSGLNNNQIIQNLQRGGYQPGQIFDAMNQADMMAGVRQSPPEQFGYQEEEQQQPFSQQPPPPVAEHEREGDRIEETVEAIIDEKWREIIKEINKIIEWKNRVESKINHMEQRVNDLKDNFDKLHQALLGKIGEYDQNIINVATEVKAMEKVFQKILPTFSENVNELSRITNALKSDSPKKKA